MKPRLPPAPPTDEDSAIWLRLKGMGFPSVMPVWYMLFDRRDADRMLRIMRMGCRFCGEDSLSGEHHDVNCVYRAHPEAIRVWNRRGARIIE